MLAKNKYALSDNINLYNKENLELEQEKSLLVYPESYQDWMMFYYWEILMQKETGDMQKIMLKECG